MVLERDLWSELVCMMY